MTALRLRHDPDCGGCLFQITRSPRTELAFADHPLVPVHLVLDSIMRRIALAEQNANDFKATLGGMLDTPPWEEFHRLDDMVFVL